ncbi:unnamed protein product [Miscanthus lutarioriparius]|uniref:DUF4220 domain-containing protein n=1 Tax=Miscanthus lutarioriparius TaxID=422564 RepID=A0A811RCD1_9POAL|nr:unnamed protein product [Miscanthus lutarioriparius]
MQSSTFRNELVVVRACFLLGCADGIAACSIDGSDQQARTMLNQAAQIVYVLFLLLSYPSSLHLQIRVVLFNVVKLSMRLWGFLLAGSREHTLAEENRFITRRDRLMPRMDVEETEMWTFRWQLLRRFTGCYPTRKEYETSWNPPGDVEEHEWEYRITEVELGFLFDFFYARHPSLHQTLVPETLVFSAAVTLSLCALFSPALLRYRGPDPEGDDALVGSSAAAVATGFDIWLTRLTIVLFLMVESFQYMTLLFSDWHKVSMACRFSVSSKSVGFHIFKLCSFECSDFKIFFHLWHGGGPNYEAELRNWEAMQAAEWSDVVKRGPPPQRQPTHLTGANAIPIHGHHRLPLASFSMEFSNFKFHNNPGRRLVFTRINFGN